MVEEMAWFKTPQGVGLALFGTLLTTAKVAVGGTAILLTAMTLLQRKIMYMPQMGTAPPDPSRLKAPYDGIEDVSLRAADGTLVKAWFWKALDSPHEQALTDHGNEASRRQTTLLMFHGNAGSRADRAQWLFQLRGLLGVNVCMVDYRGFGGSHGKPSEQGLRQDARAALQWLRTEKKAESVILVGESIGTAVSVALAGEQGDSEQVQGLVLNAGMSSIEDVAVVHYPFVRPFVSAMMWDKWNSMAHIPKIKCPSLFLHGARDQIVPIQLGRRLFEAANEPKRFVEFPAGDHNNVPFVDPPVYYTAFDQFLRAHID